MERIARSEIETKNFDNTFTELFSLLKWYERSSEGLPILAYTSEELLVAHQHIDNAVNTLLLGLKGMGQLIGMSAIDKENCEDLNCLGFFISSISDLTEALTTLRLDAGYSLKQRGIANY